MEWNNLMKLVFLEYVNESQDIKVFLYNWYFCKIVKKGEGKRENGEEEEEEE